MAFTKNRPADRGALSGVLAGVSFLGSLIGANVIAETPVPRWPASGPDIRKYFDESAKAARFSAASQLVSTASLVGFTGSVARLAKRSGSGSRALQAAALAGGGLAVASLATSAAIHAALTRPKLDDESAVRMARQMFAAGGPVHGIGFGVLTGVLALAGLRTGELPRPVAVTGFVSAAASLLSPLYFVWEPAAYLVPVGRFPGLIVSGVAGARLARASA
jgi:hypothetical protein